MHFSASIFALTCTVGLITACEVYHSGDRANCDWNCLAGAPTPKPGTSSVPSSLRSEAVKGWRQTLCRDLVSGDTETPRVDSDQNEQVVWLKSNKRTICSVHFLPASELAVPPEILLEVARDSLDKDSPRL